MEPRTPDELADALIAAIETGDLDAVAGCYAPHLSLWMNITSEEVGRDEALDVLRGFIGATSSRRYEVTSRIATETGYVQEHLLHATGTNGAHATSAACLVVDVDDGRITSIREYLDSRALASIFR